METIYLSIQTPYLIIDEILTAMGDRTVLVDSRAEQLGSCFNIA